MKIQTKTDDSLLPTNHEIRLQIGDVCCSLICDDEEVFGNLKQLYSNFLSDKPADITIKLEVTDRLSYAETEVAVTEARYIHEGNHFRTTNLIITGKHDLAGRTVSMKGERNLLNPALEFNELNRLLTMVYHTGCKVKYSGGLPALLAHSCGILRHGQVLLFAGPCESGKTTIARLCGEEYGQVLNDEAVLVSWPHRVNGVLRVQGVPFIGGVAQRLNTAAPLSCVLLLKQSQRTVVRRLSRLEAYLGFMRQVIAPAYIGQTDRQAIFSLIAEFSDEVTGAVPFYELEFTLDKESLWDVVGELETSLEKGE